MAKELLDQKFDKLFQDGKLFKLRIGMWGMGVPLTAGDMHTKDIPEKAELNGEATPAQRSRLPEIVELGGDAIQLGRKFLIEATVRNKFKSLESSARDYLKKNSFPFNMAEAFFVPNRKVIDVYKELLEYQKKYMAQVTEFEAGYTQYQANMIAKFGDCADAIRDKYPAWDHIRPKFYFEIVAFEVQAPKKMKETSLQHLVAEREKVDELKKEYDTQLRQQYDSAMARVNEFMKEAVSTARAEVVKMATTMLTKIQNKDVISATNLKTMRNITENFLSLDFFNDETVRNQLLGLQRVIDGNDNFKDDEAALASLQETLVQVNQVAASITDMDAVTGNYFRNIEI